MRGARLGQHFLNAQWVARDLARSVDIRPDEPILEIGPGKGALTKELLAQGARVIAIEKDAALVPLLNEMFEKEVADGSLTMVEGDIRDFDPEQLKLDSYAIAANIPYYITGEIIRHFLAAAKQPRAMALLIQKEVADRIVARDGKESILSLSVKAFGKPSIVAKVPAGCFNPPPSVDSAILLISGISRDFFEDISEEDFFRAVKAGFSSKRKMLAGNLKGLFEDSTAVLIECGIPEKVRAEDLRLEEWKKLVTRLGHA
ncbi:ribosomal RNA small subunit methyltransferase A [Candidatus Kaiserbacteria bacterium RIFCSPHIGHO2_01_FULL_56_24]|uniref:Ribosomal RNA small subunit methyltransferase A n=1 Tax=Candidatus Kaiserbacteria bacterium RIFCSPHIGHO2_01_FULL_56_24 TaxID=1798487 RepID=A0A1F6DAU2_9BACT|nr:MAG: ribosomal RNA small subunit methyltransferase A [Candidatus Kaiserbacteria bacterium RIFCSPHIGHO2_01_FULL_56_24]